jgi:5-methylcytosine-specific restriction endonuclease McrA
MSKGLCSTCYQFKYRQENKVHIQQSKKEFYILNKEFYAKKNKKDRESQNFDGKRVAVLKRDSYKCQECGSNDNLVVHHKDGKGRGIKHKNNALVNLTSLCKACHANVHRNELLKSRTAIQKNQWSYKYDCCICCGTINKKHVGLGCCVNCYPKYKRGTIRKKRKKLKI